MTSPQATPLLLPSDYRAALGASSPSNAMADRLLDALVEVSDLIQQMTDRRFDEYIMARKYIARSVADDGDLLDGQTLMLRADLKSVLSITNGDSTVVSVSDCELHPLNSNVKTRLVFSSDVGRWTRGTSALSRIIVDGVWGYGGKWQKTGFTVTLAAVDTLTFTTSGAVEEGMVLKVGTEYLYVEDVTAAPAPFTVTVERAYNGSTAAVHASAVSYRWRPMPVIETLMRRLVQWRGEQAKSPLVGQAVIGDFTIPISVEGIPKDVLRVMGEAGLYRKAEIA